MPGARKKTAGTPSSIEQKVLASSLIALAGKKNGKENWEKLVEAGKKFALVPKMLLQTFNIDYASLQPSQKRKLKQLVMNMLVMNM